MSRAIIDTDSPMVVDVPPFGEPGVLPRRTVYGHTPNLIPFGEAYPDKLVAPKDYKEVIAWCHEQKIFPMYHQQATWAPIGFKWNQNGLNYCTTEDTEVLTNRGWVKWPDCRDSDLLGTVNPLTHMLEFQSPIERQTLEYKGEIIHSSNKRADFSVTPNHRMYVRAWDESKRTLSSSYKFVAAENLGWYSGLMHAPKGFAGTEIVEAAVPGDRSYDGDDFLAMVAMIVADGYAGGTENTRNWVSFCCFDSRHYDRVAALAARVGFHETPSRKGVWVRYDAGALADWVRSNCYSGSVPKAISKRIPDIVKWVSSRQITHFLTWFLDQDRDRPVSAFFSVSHQVVDDLQELLLRTGKRSTPYWAPAQKSRVKQTGQVIDGGNSVCHLIVSSTDRLCLDRKKHLERDDYNGLVYCATVPNGTLVTRRNKSVLISGNCWIWSLAGAYMTTQAIEGKTVKLLSPVSLGRIVDWRNVGNYLEDAVVGMRKYGLCEMEYTPNPHSRSPKTFKDGWEDNALQNRLGDTWDTPNDSIASRIQYMISILKTGTTIYNAHNWWGHATSVVGVEWDESQKNNLRVIERNSHNEDDLIELTGDRAIPDEMIGICSSLTAV